MTNTGEPGYLNLLRDILANGERKSDRTGTGAISVFGRQLRFDISHGFPLLTTKRVGMRLIISELLWILSGSTNANDLIALNNHIWDEWAAEDGSLGPVYGAQWRSWRSPYTVNPGDGPQPAPPIDQIKWLISNLKNNPHDRGHVISAWNVSDLPLMRLRPCHCLFQFYCNELTPEERDHELVMRSLFDTELAGKIHDLDEQPGGHKGVSHARVELAEAVGIPKFALSCQLYQRSAKSALAA